MTLDQAQSAMAIWVSAIADNVKNPIAGVGAALAILEAQLVGRDTGTGYDEGLMWSSIVKMRDRLAQLDEYVTELAGYSRPASLRFAVADVGRVAMDALRAAELPSQCDVAVTVEPGLQVIGDVAKLVLVLKALLKNAYEAVEADVGPRLALGAERAADDQVRLIVDDNGPGLPADTVARVFEPFFSTKEAGTGLGLAIARKYVEAHGGTINFARSGALGGCRVEILIPRKPLLAKETP